VDGLCGFFNPPKMSIGGTNNPSWYATNRIVETINTMPNTMPRRDPIMALLVFISKTLLYKCPWLLYCIPVSPIQKIEMMAR
jgi:hypothetical protein